MDNFQPLPSCKAWRYWAKRGGGYYEPNKPKGHTQPWGLVMKVKRGSNIGGTSNNQPTGRRNTRFYPGRYSQPVRTRIAKR